VGAGSALFADATPERRDFAKICPAAYCFAVVNMALDIDLGFVAAAVSHPSEKQRIARAGRDRFVIEGWAEKARSHGWSERALFALPERWSRVDQCGVAWLVGERRVNRGDGGCDRGRNGARRAPQILSEGVVALGTSYLTGRTLAENMTEPGQADWARPDAATTCRGCLFWAGGKRDRWGALKPAICRKAQQMLLLRRLPPVPHHAHSCRFFEANPSPPEAMK
jgi:hypothetical protein